MKAIVFDLDNTIADDGWRINKIEPAVVDIFWRYHNYHSLSGFDEVGNRKLILNAPEVAQIIFTSRPVSYRTLTEEWLRRNGIQFKHLVMRGNDDHRSSVEVKRDQLKIVAKYFDLRPSDIIAAYDDRQDVVDMFRSFGILASLAPLHNIPYPSCTK